MSTKTTLILALAAGFLGGIASQHIALAPVFAQSQTPIPKEIRAQSFVAVDETGTPRAVFGVNEKEAPSSHNPFALSAPKAHQPIIQATDTKGRLYWINLTVGKDMVREKGTPTLLPQK